MKLTLVLFLLFSILNIAEINANDLEKEYVIHNDSPKVIAKLIYSCSAAANEGSSPTINQNTLNQEPENFNFNFTKMIGTFQDGNVEGTISFNFASAGIKIEIIFN